MTETIDAAVIKSMVRRIRDDPVTHSALIELVRCKVGKRIVPDDVLRISTDGFFTHLAIVLPDYAQRGSTVIQRIFDDVLDSLLLDEVHRNMRAWAS